jgi:phage-related protein
MTNTKYLSRFPSLGQAAHFTFNGINSRDYDIAVERLPDIIVPKRRAQTLTIPGKSGCLHLEDSDVYDSYTKNVECVLLSEQNAQRLPAWLTGAGQAVFSNEPLRQYEVFVKSPIYLSRFVNSFQRFVLSLECQPYKYELNQTALVWALPSLPVASAKATLRNPGTATAMPIVKLFGTGTIRLFFREQNIEARNVQDCAVIDSRTMFANCQTAGTFPFFLPGENELWVQGNVTRMEILPYWRWL